MEFLGLFGDEDTSDSPLGFSAFDNNHFGDIAIGFVGFFRIYPVSSKIISGDMKQEEGFL